MGDDGGYLFGERLWRQSGRRQVRVERIELSMPDSVFLAVPEGKINVSFLYRTHVHYSS
ncbi:MAG: hypothetical protein LBQ39_00420 [Tannerellaceae bacterium]|jgi:hypothetical protein|nr:hypothetical protein [Tannerellaceae bacterium]